MAASRRLLFSNLLRIPALVHLKNLPQLSAFNVVRNSSYKSSPQVRDINDYPDVEVIHNPPEWEFVERLLPPTTVPKPTPKPEYPSGWKPQSKEDIEKFKYFVARTKNHMVPVYLKTTYRGERRVTIVRRVQGDIWTLERKLRALVEHARKGKTCATRVNEMSGQIHIHGDYVDVVREYLKACGF